MRYLVRIVHHTIVDEKNPFLIYAVEVHSSFSKRIVLKQFQHFVSL